MRQRKEKVSARFIIINPLLETQNEIHLDSVWKDTLYGLLDEIEDLGYQVTDICLDEEKR